MIIVHVSTFYYPSLGGLERVVQKLAEAQAELGHEVHVVTSTCGAGGRPREERVGGVYVHRVKALKPHYPDLTAPLEVPRDVLKRTDIVHVHSQNSYFNVRIAEEAKRAGVPVAVHFMAVDALRTHPNFAKRWLGYVYQSLMTRRALGLADLRFVKSFRDKRVLEEEYGVEAVYIPDGIDEYFFARPRNPSLFRDVFGVDEEYVFLYIGRLHPAKGSQILVEAAAYLRRYMKERFKVVLIGPGHREWLSALAKRLNVGDLVLLTGPVDEEVKISAIDASTCVVIPSLYDYVEVFSLVASEAWARRKPVVAFAVGELVYRVKHGVNGLLVEQRNPRALAAALREIVSGKYEFKVDEKLYTWGEIASKLVEFYDKLHPVEADRTDRSSS